MKARLGLLAVLVLGGCMPVPPPLPPADGPGTCESACANARALGGCGLDLTYCEADCHDASSAEATLRVRFPVDCMSAAKSCEEMRQCR
jgi:hypothetical protein